MDKQALIDYKKDLNERNIQPLSDDYIKFIRYGQYFVDKNGEGALAYISNNSFIDGIIHRQMRKSLLDSFDTIYIIDLHGNSNKKETAEDGGKDENVFDIQQGVSINIFVKNKIKTKKQASVYHTELYGKRADKYDFLDTNSLKSIKWNELEYSEPNFFFVPKDFSESRNYDNGFMLCSLFGINGRGTSFRKDSLLVKNHDNKESVIEMLRDMNSLSDKDLTSKYDFSETSDWLIRDKKVYFADFKNDDIKKVFYRPFDIKYTYYPMDKINKIIVRGDDKKALMKHLLVDNNFGIVLPKQAIEGLGILVLMVFVRIKLLVLIIQTIFSRYIFTQTKTH
jgi:predicted helicase